MEQEAANRRLIERFWEDLYRLDFEKVGASSQTTANTPTCRRRTTTSRAGRKRSPRVCDSVSSPLEAILHHPGPVAADGDIVFTEHAEEWRWPSGERVTIKFVSVHEIRGGKIVRWWDHPDLGRLLGAAPQWWLEHVSKGYK